ncbi:hypothetical protein [Mucilaginibacter lacusdianchii]|uniref:hypothetical protein n=1 Tax=Mucilaginibacter lacusdianchii TaxID=2684211 RepID=UPI00131C813A|nr:hypothetical protein [Mucilaginibacter sp. JXJ CY 39]
MRRRIVTIVTLVVLIALAGIVYYRYYYVFGDGVKAGTMNYFVHKGYMFKTYEGRIIQSGIRTQPQGSVQSNEFMFSVTDERVAQQLNNNAGGYLKLHYKEYFHTLPWRGVSRYVVDSVVSAEPLNPAQP